HADEDRRGHAEQRDRRQTDVLDDLLLRPDGHQAEDAAAPDHQDGEDEDQVEDPIPDRLAERVGRDRQRLHRPDTSRRYRSSIVSRRPPTELSRPARARTASSSRPRSGSASTRTSDSEPRTEISAPRKPSRGSVASSENGGPANVTSQDDTAGESRSARRP